MKAIILEFKHFPYTTMFVSVKKGLCIDLEEPDIEGSESNL